MFVRVKTISGRPYGYLVENTWKKGKVSQKVKSYLGPVVKPDKISETSFEEWKDVDLEAYIGNTKIKQIMRAIVEHTLSQYDLDGLEWKRNAITRKGKDIVLELEDGYFYTQAARNLINVKPVEEKRPGKHLAEQFALAGIQPDKRLFVLLYRKLYNV